VYGHSEYEVITKIENSQKVVKGIDKVFKESAIHMWTDQAVIDTLSFIGIGEEGMEWVQKESLAFLYGGCKIVSEVVVTWDEMCKVRSIYDMYVETGIAGEPAILEAA